MPTRALRLREPFFFCSSADCLSSLEEKLFARLQIDGPISLKSTVGVKEQTVIPSRIQSQLRGGAGRKEQPRLIGGSGHKGVGVVGIEKLSDFLRISPPCLVGDCRTAEPVSYTHLDVYKRQPQSFGQADLA